MNYEITPEGRARFGLRTLSGVPIPRVATEPSAQPLQEHEDTPGRMRGLLKPVRELVERALREPDDSQTYYDSVK